MIRCPVRVLDASLRKIVDLDVLLQDSSSLITSLFAFVWGSIFLPVLMHALAR